MSDRWWHLGAMAMVIGLAACGDDDTSGGGSGGGGSGATTTTASTADTTTASAGAGGADAFTPMNGCDPATALDLQDQAVEIQFPMNGLAYSPPCIIIHATHSVNFVGVDSTFVSHPLVGGVVEDGVATPDASSPIGKTTTGDSTTINFETPGQYGFYCDFHFSSGMMGTVYVEEAPE
jgi:plastocyanin